MKRKVYWKDLFASFTHSKGRFLSILTLMLLGSLALVGLKVTTPNMHRTANQFYSATKDARSCCYGGLGIRPGRPRGAFKSQRGACRIWFTAGFDSERDRRGNSTFFCPKMPFFFSCDQGAPCPKKEGELALARFLEGSLSDRGYPHT